jgi:hypothetical protein
MDKKLNFSNVQQSIYILILINYIKIKIILLINRESTNVNEAF